MQERNLRVLEFHKVCEMLVEHAVSHMGKQLAAQLTPSSDFKQVKLWQDETEEAGTVLTYLGSNPMPVFSDVRDHLRRAALGSALSPKGLLDIAELLRAARSLRSSLITDREDTPILTDLAKTLTTNRALEDKIFMAILSEEEISDHASSELNSIRRHMRRCNDSIRAKLNSIIQNSNTQKYLQDSLITVRNGRYVIPVRSEYRQNVPGLVHDQSASGATLFIEPMSVVEINNDLKQWQIKEKQEIERILMELSAQIAPDAEMIGFNLQNMAYIDLIFAKAGLARSINAVQPKLNQAGWINLKKARHPMIDPERVIPLDLWIGREFSVLVVTGPNTGGKTVALKTVGLLTLMAQAGLQIPAAYGSEVSVFDEVFADIGDEQSIEQSLSTFSSHMTNIVDILAKVTPKSLALFDELGAGTDPTEGAALGTSILEHLRKRQVTVLATTHYSELKAYALSQTGVENASVEFDVQTLRPTYRLSIGVPGKSNAFEISRKLGLGEDLIGDAAERLTQDQIRFEDVIANAEYHRQIAEKERVLAEQAHLETQKLRNEAEKLQKQIADQRNDMLKKAKDDAKKVLQKAQREAEEIISTLKRSRIKNGAELKEHEINEMRKKLRNSIGEMNEALAAPDESSLSAPPKNLKPGDLVKLAHLNTTGTVISPPNDKGEVMVQAGIMKMKAHISQLRAEQAPQKVKPVKSSVSKVQIAAHPVTMECDVRGMNLEDAIMEVDQFIDNAVLQGLKTLSIIHGKGTGVLRSGIREHLKRYPPVAEQRPGKYGEGEDGITVVTLK